MGQFESLLWARRARSPRRPRVHASALTATSPLGEWTAPPLGRLGRPLVSEIELYLAFFSVARGSDSPGTL